MPTDLAAAEAALNEGDVHLLRELLQPFLAQGNPAAIRMNACLGDAGMSAAESEKHFVEGMFQAAELGDSEALYQVGVFYDTGTYGIPTDKIKAAEIFEALSDRGHIHCMWLHACALLWGNGAIPRDEQRGLALLIAAAEHGSGNACMTLAGLYAGGDFGLPRNHALRDKYRALAKNFEKTVFDPFE